MKTLHNIFVDISSMYLIDEQNLLRNEGDSAIISKKYY